MTDQRAEIDEAQLVIRLELDSEYDSELDQAIVGEVGREALVTLKQEAYTVLPVDTHTRGGEFVVDLLKVVWEHRATIEHAATDLSVLISILSDGVVPAIKFVAQAYTKRAIPESAPIKFILDIDGATIQVEVNDLQQAEAVLQIARRFQSNHPQVACQVSSKSKTKIKGKLPKQQRRKRR